MKYRVFANIQRDLLRGARQCEEHRFKLLTEVLEHGVLILRTFRVGIRVAEASTRSSNLAGGVEATSDIRLIQLLVETASAKKFAFVVGVDININL